jgi:hypothetical protein
MNSTISLNVQRRINTLDSASILAIVVALASYAIPLMTTVFLIGCLICQVIIFRSYYKFLNDPIRIGKRVTCIVTICIAIITLIVTRGIL